MTPHVDVGAYLLGALDDDEMTRFEEHLAECESCGQELDELSGLLPVLDEMRTDGIGYVEVAPPAGDAMLHRLLEKVSGERRRRSRRRLAAAATAAVVAIGAPAVAVVAAQEGDPSPAAAPAFAADRHSASDPATGASAVVGVTNEDWGSAVDLRLSGVHGPLTCSLYAVGQDGSRQTVATWSVPDAGYGTRAQPTPLTVHGATGMHASDIGHFDVRVADGTLLVSVPA